MKMARPRDKSEAGLRQYIVAGVVERRRLPLMQDGDSHHLPGGHLWGKVGPVSPELKFLQRSYSLGHSEGSQLSHS